MMSVFESNQTHKASMYYFITWPTIFCLCNQNSDYERKEELLTLLNMTAYNTVTCSINIYTLRSPVLKDVSLEWNGQKLLWDGFCSCPSSYHSGPLDSETAFSLIQGASQKQKWKHRILESSFVILFHVHATRFFFKSESSQSAYESSLWNSLILLLMGDLSRACKVYLQWQPNELYIISLNRLQ